MSGPDPVPPEAPGSPEPAPSRREPEEQPREVAGAPAPGAAPGRTPGNALALAGVVLIAVGGFALLRQVVPGIGSVAGPLVLLAAGVLLILAARR